MHFYFYIIGSVISYIAGDFYAKNWSVKNDWKFLAATLLLYALGGLFFAFAIKKSSLSLAVIAIPLATTIVGLTFAYFYFGERLTPTQYFGFGLGILALIFLLFPIKIFG